MSSFGTKSILLRHNIASHPKKFTAISFRTSAQESDLHIFAVIEHFYIKDKRGGLWFYQIVLILLHRFNGALK